MEKNVWNHQPVIVDKDGNKAISNLRNIVPSRRSQHGPEPAEAL